MHQYRLQFFTNDRNVLAINWASQCQAKRFQLGDCVVRAIHATTDVATHNRARHQRQEYSDPMTIEDARAFIAANVRMLGTHIRTCVGLVLEDHENRLIVFPNPIPVHSGTLASELR